MVGCFEALVRAVLCLQSFQLLHLYTVSLLPFAALASRVARCSAVQVSFSLLHSLRGGHSWLRVVVAATAELCVRRAGLRLLTVHVSRASTPG